MAKYLVQHIMLVEEVEVRHHKVPILLVVLEVEDLDMLDQAPEELELQILVEVEADLVQQEAHRLHQQELMEVLEL